MEQALDFSRSIPWFGWVAIVAIVSGSVTGLANAWFRHRERIEMIRLGMHPDAPGAKASVPEL